MTPQTGYTPLRDREIDAASIEELCRPISAKKQPFAARFTLDGSEKTQGQDSHE
ncbi:hypothetical protein OU789_10885 [Halocynthiibacter sp. C4]|uniref:hypothetical protein n=1 Tax=Halocynthiibacter sp. C4 TaxID=2992758 RepID=UPI00237A9139|nr:hypothetical protein [Halocynthiibacter sp. C4]MDE0590432.1 hypothetical protein [Halocynthiibacter sp. C4]